MRRVRKKTSFCLIIFILCLTFQLFSGEKALAATTGGKVQQSTGVGLASHGLTAYRQKWRYEYGAMRPGAVDCSGLIMSYNGVGGIRWDMVAASPKVGTIATLPRIHGLGLYQPGHVGVYVGNGMSVDARNSRSGVCYQSIKGMSWTKWFKVKGVEYPTKGLVIFDGKKYYYEKGQYIVNTARVINGKKYYFGKSGSLQYVTDAAKVNTKKVGKPTGVKLKGVGYHKLQISWNRVKAADGYYVYRSSSPKGNFGLIQTVTSGEKTSYTNQKLIPGKTYYYVVRAYRKTKTQYEKGAASQVISAKPIPIRPKTITAKSGRKKATLCWSKVAGATNYYLYYATNQAGPYTRVNTKSQALSYTCKGLQSGKAYYFYVRGSYEKANSQVKGVRSKILRVSIA